MHWLSHNMTPPFFFMLYNAIDIDLEKILLSSLKIYYKTMHQNCAYSPPTLQYTQWQCIGKRTVIHFVTFSQFRKQINKKRGKEQTQQFPLSFIFCHYYVRFLIFQDCCFPAKWNAKLLKPWEIIRTTFILEH